MENATLAPSAGTGVGKLLADALLNTPGFVQLMVDALVGGLRADMPPRWDKHADKWTTAADHRTRVQTVTLILAHMEGEPIKRIIHQHLGGAEIDAMAAIRESPALQAAMERTLANAKFRDRNKKPEKPAERSIDLED